MTKHPRESNAAAGRMIGNWLSLLFRSWIVMLALGAFAHEADYEVALGYWAVMLGLLVIRMSLSGLAVNTLTFFRDTAPPQRLPRLN